MGFSFSITETEYRGSAHLNTRLMKEMDDFIPGSAKALFDEGIANSKSRRALEAKVIPSQVNQSLVGQIGGFILGMSALFIA